MQHSLKLGGKWYLMKMLKQWPLRNKITSLWGTNSPSQLHTLQSHTPLKEAFVPKFMVLLIY